jgi:hypothetical protein
LFLERINTMQRRIQGIFQRGYILSEVMQTSNDSLMQRKERPQRLRESHNSWKLIDVRGERCMWFKMLMGTRTVEMKTVQPP